MFPFNQYIILFVFLRFMKFRKSQDGKMKEATKSRVAGKSNYIHDEYISIVFCILCGKDLYQKVMNTN